MVQTLLALAVLGGCLAAPQPQPSGVIKRFTLDRSQHQRRSNGAAGRVFNPEFMAKDIAKAQRKSTKAHTRFQKNLAASDGQIVKRGAAYAEPFDIALLRKRREKRAVGTVTLTDDVAYLIDNDVCCPNFHLCSPS